MILSSIEMNQSLHKHLAVAACVVSLIVLYMLMTQGKEPTSGKHSGYKPPILWGYGDDSETSCTDSVDNDNDGLIDCEDSDCSNDASCQEQCTNLIDDNNNGLIDCEDPACANDPNCP